MAAAGLQTTQPLALGLQLDPQGAGVQTTLPLVLGLALPNPPWTLTAGTGSVPITSKDADLVAQSASADIGVSVPLILGLQLATAGSTNYTLTASAGSVQITSKNANVFASSDTAQLIFTAPLAFGMLLTEQSFTLVADAGNVIINVAPSDSTEFEFAARVPGGHAPQSPHARRRRVNQDEIDVLDLLMAIAKGVTCH